LLSKNIKIKMHRTKILPVVSYGCETLSLTVREEYKMRVFGRRVGLKGTRQKGMEGNCIMQSLMISAPHQILSG
jgi:hypothetical protein